MKYFLLGLAFCSGLQAAAILYGGLGGHNNGDSTNDGSLSLVDQATGLVTVIGHPAGISRISGLVFDSLGALYASTQPGGGFPPPPGPTGASRLLRLDPNTGAILSNLAILVGSTAISIADLAVQPGTDVLFGIRGPNDQLNGQGSLYTINKSTGAATFIGNTGDFFGSIAFAPNGTLYMSSADLDANGNFVNVSLKTLNPGTAAILTTVATNDFFGALAVRPTDGVIFGGTGDSQTLFTITPGGVETLVGNTGRNFVGDLAFQTPEPASMLFAALGLAVIIGSKFRYRFTSAKV